MPPVPLAAFHDFDAVAAALRSDGVCRLHGFPDPTATSALHADLLRLHRAGRLGAAAVGRGAEQALRADIRGDRTLWLDDAQCGAVAASYLAALETLRKGLNERLLLGLHEVEAHYAAYPAGGGYARHRDRFRDSDARVLSLVSYLNEDWRESDGGALRLYLDGDDAVLVPPDGGTSVCFLSGLEHEVMPASRQRLSIAAWMRRRT